MIAGNTSNDYAGGISINYGGSPTIINSIITNNSATYDGGGITVEHGANPLILNTIISNNSAGDYGGGIMVRWDSSPIFKNCTISDNICYYFGGGIYSDYSEPVLENCAVVNNNGTLKGGGCYLASSQNSIFMNCVFCSNSASESAGAIYFDGSSAEVQFCNFYDNSGGDFHGSVPASLGTITGINANGDPCDDLSNIYLDPQFTDLLNLDLNLQVSSPCIDAGNPAADYYDPEDPWNLGMALFPSLGTITNDMGIYGGNGAAGALGIKPEKNDTGYPTSTALLQNYPNPFNPNTTISFELQIAGHVNLGIFDIKGCQVYELIDGFKKSGYHEIIFEATGLPSGIYFCRLESDDFTVTRKMILLK
ncbi:hypothetical protein CEE37_07565 [candidate division LCP-89 bacterium B3_LCP]|uniref:Secretion system C-terminal sorting domain-containing protein n=1 Tax=candidate division LCP-89 bacterium B3_LCP TaxID=2012998 RepID=A0A532V0S2_UNCL8|nr:MAG: hypothetical protein CEE37_07565 [candidate division LCP-89 bacterium B3_LCP]